MGKLSGYMRRKKLHVADAETQNAAARVVGVGKSGTVGKGIGASFKVIGTVKIEKPKLKERS